MEGQNMASTIEKEIAKKTVQSQEIENEKCNPELPPVSRILSIPFVTLSSQFPNEKCPESKIISFVT